MKSQAKTNVQKALNLNANEKLADIIRVKQEVEYGDESENLSHTEETLSETNTSDFAMASVLTTLAAQSHVLQEPEQSPISLVKSSFDFSMKLPKSASTVTSVLKPHATKHITDSISKINTTENPAVIQGSVNIGDRTVLKTSISKSGVISPQTHGSSNGSNSQFVIIKSEHSNSKQKLADSASASPKSNTGSETLNLSSDTASPALNSDAIKTLLKMRLAMQGLQGSQSPAVNQGELLVDNQSLSQSNETNAEEMVNVLTSLAMQQVSKGGTVTVADPTVEVSKDAGEQNRFIISYDPETGAPQVQGIIVSEGVAQVIDQSGNKLLIQSSESVPEDSEQVLDQSANDKGESYTAGGPLDLHSGSNVTVYTDPNATPALRSPCPVCSDAISGNVYQRTC